MKTISYKLGDDGFTGGQNSSLKLYAGEHNATRMTIVFDNGNYGGFDFALQFHTPDCTSPRLYPKKVTDTVLELDLPSAVMKTGQVQFDLEALSKDKDGKNVRVQKIAHGSFTVNPAITNGKLYNGKYYDELYLMEQEYISLKNSLMDMIDRYLKEKYGELDKAAAELRTKLEAKVDSFINEARSKFSQMNEDFEHFMTNARVDLQSLLTTRGNELKNLISDGNKQLDDMQTEFERFMADARTNIGFMLTARGEDINRLISDGNTWLENSKSDFEKFIADCNKRFEELVEKLPDTIRTLLESGEYDDLIKNISGGVGKIWTDENGEEKGEVFNVVRGGISSKNKASGYWSHAEGFGTTARGDYSHAEGSCNDVLGSYAHVEGANNKAGGAGSHAEGRETVTLGRYSHTEGSYTRADGEASHASGSGTLATEENQFVCGSYNAEDKNAVFIVGIGTPFAGHFGDRKQATLKNGFTVTKDGIAKGTFDGAFLYDNSKSTLSATTVKNAVDELDGKIGNIDAVLAAVVNGEEISDDNS